MGYSSAQRYFSQRKACKPLQLIVIRLDSRWGIPKKLQHDQGNGQSKLALGVFERNRGATRRNLHAADAKNVEHPVAILNRVVQRHQQRNQQLRNHPSPSSELSPSSEMYHRAKQLHKQDMQTDQQRVWTIRDALKRYART